MKKTNLFIFVAISIFHLVSGQTGAIAKPSKCSCGNHFHWDNAKTNPLLDQDDIEKHLGFFHSTDYDHENDLDHHVKGHNLSKMRENQILKDLLKEEKKDDWEALNYGRYRSRTEDLYNHLTDVDEYIKKVKSNPCNCTLKKLD